MTRLYWDMRSMGPGVHVWLRLGDSSLPFALRAEDVPSSRSFVEDRISTLRRYASAKIADPEDVERGTVDALICQMRAMAGTEVTDLR